MEIIVPAAGLSSRFPNMKPKYLLYDYKGELMIANSIKQFLGEFNITIGILAEHDQKYNASEFLKHEFGDNINIVVLDKPTKGPADTVYQIIKKMGPKDSPIFIKDCDSFFNHKISGGNYVCVSNIADHEVLKKLSSKSFTIANEHGIIHDIVEKSVVSSTFCVGGYKFSSSKQFISVFENLKMNREIFVSDIIGTMLGLGDIFFNREVTDYVDVGTSSDWFEFNNKPVIFCDIDGTIIEAQSRLDLENFEPVVKLEKNVAKLLELQSKGSQFVFTTARESKYKTLTKCMLHNLGFKNFQLVCGLQNSGRILINDYNSSNPHPRAVAINIKRNSDNLEDFL
jgi:choline kinase